MPRPTMVTISQEEYDRLLKYEAAGNVLRDSVIEYVTQAFLGTLGPKDNLRTHIATFQASVGAGPIPPLP